MSLAFAVSFTTQGAPLERLQQEEFGKLADGSAVHLYTLRNTNGMVVKVVTYGAVLLEVQAPDRNGALTNVVLRAPSLEDYVKGFRGSGAVIGRVANRIAGARFTLDGKEYPLSANNGTNHIHGVFAKSLWQATPQAKTGLGAVRLTYFSKDMEDGFPGNMQVAVTYTLNDLNELRLDYEASTDKPTIVNLTSHAYFNLAGHGDVLDHEVWLAASRYTPVDDSLIPTGEIADVKGTPLDFTKPERIGARIQQLKPRPGGYDHNYVIDGGGKSLTLAARVREPGSGRRLEVRTTQPGVQFFTANHLQHAAFCLETQHYPDSIHHPAFPSVVLRPGERFESTTVFAFSAK